MNVNLSPVFEKYIHQLIEAGTYNNASEIIREALRIKMQQDDLNKAKLEALKSAIVEGENSGVAVPFDIDNIIQEAKSDTEN